MIDKRTVVARKPGTELSWPDQYVVPFSTFRAEMVRLMDGFFGSGCLAMWPSMFSPHSDEHATGAMHSGMDVNRAHEKITMMAELPGMSEEKDESTFRDSQLAVKGKKRSGDSNEEDNLYFSKTGLGIFYRTFRPSEGIDANKIEAHANKGVLMMIVFKKFKAVNPTRENLVGKDQEKAGRRLLHFPTH